jgi:hypothetical protein
MDKALELYFLFVLLNILSLLRKESVVDRIQVHQLRAIFSGGNEESRHGKECWCFLLLSTIVLMTEYTKPRQDLRIE